MHGRHHDVSVTFQLSRGRDHDVNVLAHCFGTPYPTHSFGTPHPFLRNSSPIALEHLTHCLEIPHPLLTLPIPSERHTHSFGTAHPLLRNTSPIASKYLTHCSPYPFLRNASPIPSEHLTHCFGTPHSLLLNTSTVASEHRIHCFMQNTAPTLLLRNISLIASEHPTQPFASEHLAHGFVIPLDGVCTDMLALWMCHAAARRKLPLPSSRSLDQEALDGRADLRMHLYPHSAFYLCSKVDRMMSRMLCVYACTQRLPL